MDPLDGLGPFVAVVRARSFSAAARELGVPRETLSRQVAALEVRLGAKLLHRTTRRIVTTPAGEELYQRAAEIVAAAAAALAAVRATDGVPRGRLRVSLPTVGAAFSPLIQRFAEAYPLVEIEVVCTNRFVDLVAEGFDAAIRAGAVHDPALMFRLLGRTENVAVAAPSYLRARGTPRTPADLAGHSCLRGLGGGSRPVTGWPLRDGGEVPVTGPIATDAMDVLYQLALDGAGIALLPVFRTAADLAQGTLLHVVPEVAGSGSIGVVYPEAGKGDPKVRAFVAHAVAFWPSLVPNP